MPLFAARVHSCFIIHVGWISLLLQYTQKKKASESMAHMSH